MHFEAPMVEQMEEINVSEVIEEPVDKPEIETRTIEEKSCQGNIKTGFSICLPGKLRSPVNFKLCWH